MVTKDRYTLDVAPDVAPAPLQVVGREVAERVEMCNTGGSELSELSDEYLIDFE